MPYYPLLDIQDAWDDALDNIEDMKRRLETLHQECEGQYPPDTTYVLARLVRLRVLLNNLIPAAMREAIAKERQQYEEDDEYWNRD
jgi:hypothetical protein